MTKRRLLSMLLTLAMLVSMFPMTLSASETPVKSIELVLEADKEYVNAGETVTVSINALATGEAVDLASYNLAIDYDTDVFEVMKDGTKVFTDVIKEVETAQNGNKLAWFYGTDNTNTIAIDASGVVIAKVTLKALAGVVTTEASAVTVTDANFALATDNLKTGFEPDVTPATVDVYNIKVAIAANENAGIDADTAYAKYNEAGLYIDNTYAEEYTLPTPNFADNYREGEGWMIGSEKYDGTYEFTEDATLTYDAELYWVVTANAGEGTADPATLEVADGTNLLDALADIDVTPENDYYEFVKWTYENGDEIGATDTVTEAVTVVAVYKALDVDVSFVISYVGEDGNAADPEIVGATYGEYLVIKPAKLDGYILTEVVGMEDQNDGTWKSTDVIDSDMSVQLTYNEILEHTFASNIPGVTYDSIYSVAGVEGVYTDAALTEEATALPAVADVTIETDKERYTFDGATWAVELSELSGANVTTAVVSRLNAIHQFYVTFEVAADAELTNADDVVAASDWYNAGEAVDYPDATTEDASITAEFTPAQITALDAATTVTVTTIATPLVTITTEYVGVAQTANAELTGKYYGDIFGVDLNTPEGYIAEVVISNADGVLDVAPETITEALTVKVIFREVLEMTFKADGLADVVLYAKAGVAGLYTTAACDVAADAPVIAEQYKVVVENDTRYNYGENNDYGYVADDYTADQTFTAEYTTEYYITFVGDAEIANVPASDWYEAGTTPVLSTDSKNEFYTVSWDKAATAVTEATTYTATAEAKVVATLADVVVVGADSVDAEPTISGTKYGDTLVVNVPDVVGFVSEYTVTYNADGSEYDKETLDNYVTVTVTYRKVLTVTFVKTGVETYTFDAVAGVVGLTKDGAAATAPALTQYETIVENESRYNYGENPTWTGYDATVALTADATYTVTPTTEYYITAIAGEGVESVAGSNWYAEGAALALTATAKEYYNQDAITWTPALPETVSAAGEYTATAAPMQYDVTVSDESNLITNLTGVTEGKGTYGTAISFTVTDTTATVVITGAEYTAEAGVYTIAGDKVTGAITITVTAGYTVTFKAGENVTMADVTEAVKKGEKLAASQIPADGYTFATGYEFDGWYVDGSKVEDLTAMEITADTIVTLNAKKSTYTITYVDANTAAAIDVTTYQVGDTITITPAADATAIISDVSYVIESVDGANDVVLADGKYTITGITGNITVTVTSTAVEFIDAGIDGYAVLENTTKIIKLGGYTENTATVTVDGKQAFYSDRYDAYVAIIGKDVTVADLAEKLVITATATADDMCIKYTGDVNGNGKITAGDAALVSNMLHNPVNASYTDMMRFAADYYAEGAGYVTASDCTAILWASVDLEYGA